MKICKQLDLPWAIIGGVALPAYKVTRTTLDLDVAISFGSQKKIEPMYR